MKKLVMIQWQLNSSIADSCDFNREIMPKGFVSYDSYSHAYNQEHEYDYQSKKINI